MTIEHVYILMIGFIMGAGIVFAYFWSQIDLNNDEYISLYKYLWRYIKE